MPGQFVLQGKFPCDSPGRISQIIQQVLITFRRLPCYSHYANSGKRRDNFLFPDTPASASASPTASNVLQHVNSTLTSVHTSSGYTYITVQTLHYYVYLYVKRQIQGFGARCNSGALARNPQSAINEAVCTATHGDRENPVGCNRREAASP